MNEVILIPAIYDGSRDLKDKTKKLVFQTNEITPKQASELQVCVQQFVYLAIKLEPFMKDQIELMQNLKQDFDEFGKTPGQRLRGTLYRRWQQCGEGYKNFEMYYAYRMEQFINGEKAKLL